MATKAVKASIKTKPTLLDKINAYLFEHGVTRRKAAELSKGLVTVARNTVLAEQRAKAKLALDKDSKSKQFTITLGNAKEPLQLSKGVADEGLVLPPETALALHLRIDLPVVPVRGDKGIELLQRMDGLYTRTTYIAAAVKGEDAVIAVRKLSGDEFNVKFYPSFEAWGFNQEQLTSLGAKRWTYVKRNWYERMHFGQAGLDQILGRVNAEAKKEMGEKNPLKRLLSITVDFLIGGFKELYGY